MRFLLLSLIVAGLILVQPALAQNDSFGCVYKDVEILAPKTVNASVGTASVFNVGVRNTGNCTLANIRISISGLPGWSSVSGIVDILYPDMAKYIPLSLTPPRTISSGVYNMTINADVELAYLHVRKNMYVSVAGVLWANQTTNETNETEGPIGEEEVVAHNEASEAQELIRTANEKIQEASAGGKDIKEANDLLQQAIDEFEKQNYVLSKELAVNANQKITEVMEMNETAGDTIMEMIQRPEIMTVLGIVVVMVIILIVVNKFVLGRREDKEVEELREELGEDEEESDEESEEDEDSE